MAITDNVILVVDDEKKIIDVVQSYLEHNGFIVHSASNGIEALEMFERTSPCLVILDLMLPDITGEEICKKIRTHSNVPIIMLTAKVDENNILYGLNIGADDYITKPFSPRQLVARVNAVLRRTQFHHTKTEPIYCSDNLYINSTSHEVKINGKEISLTPNEYKILIKFVQYPNKVFTRDDLINTVFGDDFDGFDRTIDTHIKNIRKKLEDDPRRPKYIVTIHGVGYKFGGEKNET